MRRDSIFYRLFSYSPLFLFQLLDHPPEDAAAYSFDSVAVKEPTFTIDGVFLPPDSSKPGTVFFCEIQFQKDQRLYERLFAESFLYFYRNRDRFSNWKAVIIYPSSSMEQDERVPYEVLLESQQVARIYLDELGEVQQLPLETGLMVLTTLTPSKAPEAARELLTRARQSQDSRGMIEIITAIMAYKFTYLSRQEIEQMLDISLQETRFYQEAKAEGRQEGLQEGRQEGRQEGIQEGIQEGERSLLLRQLGQKLGVLPDGLVQQIQALNLKQLEDLAIALLNFSSVADLEDWLHNP